MKLLALKLFFLLSLVTVLCLAVDFAYRKSNNFEYAYPKHLWLNPTIKEKYQLVTVGNSHAQSGITFENYKIRSKNLSSVAQRFSLDYALLKQYSNQIEKGAIILIPVTPISFAHHPLNVADTLQTNYYDSVSPLLIPHLHIGNYIQGMVVPFVRSGYLLRTQYAHTVAERISKENNRRFQTPAPATPLPTPVVSVPPSVVVPTPLPRMIRLSEPDFLVFPIEPISNNLDFLYNKWYNTPEFSPTYFDENRRDLEKIISYSLEQGWQPILITIPISSDLRKTLLGDYMEVYLYKNLKKTNTGGAPYFDFSDELRIATNSSYFANGDHLNPRGAALFSYTLLQKLIEQKILTQEVDGFEYYKQIQ